MSWSGSLEFYHPLQRRVSANLILCIGQSLGGPFVEVQTFIVFEFNSV